MKVKGMNIAAARVRGWLLWLPALLLALAGAGWAQTASGPYTIGFSFEFPGAVPPSYEVTVKSDGQATYRSDEAPQAGAAQGEPYSLQFTVSEATRNRLFDLAKQANFFQGDFDYHKGKIANMGAKTLTYSDTGGSHKTQYNYSMDAAILQITKLFQDLSSTLEYNRRLTFLYRFDKLGIDAELKNMEAAAKQGDLAELQVAQPILSQIAEDHGVMNVARRRADELLRKMATGPAPRAQ